MSVGSEHVHRILGTRQGTGHVCRTPDTHQCSGHVCRAAGTNQGSGHTPGHRAHTRALDMSAGHQTHTRDLDMSVGHQAHTRALDMSVGNRAHGRALGNTRGKCCLMGCQRQGKHFFFPLCSKVQRRCHVVGQTSGVAVPVWTHMVLQRGRFFLWYPHWSKPDAWLEHLRGPHLQHVLSCECGKQEEPCMPVRDKLGV